MKQILSRLKPYLRWVIFGGMLFFLAKALKDHWREVAAIRIDGAGWLCLAIAAVVTLLAQTWAGWMWSWILREFKHPMSTLWLIQVYLKTNIAKYLPGNVFHYSGRIWILTKAGVPTPTATLSVLIEPILFAAAALLLILIPNQINREFLQNPWSWQVFCSVTVLMLLHPWFLNPVLKILEKFEGKPKNSTATDALDLKIERYPLIPLGGAIGFLLIRGLGFLLIFMALTPVNLSQVPMLVSSFNLAWVSSLIIPGAPGGIGVFEATAVALLNEPFSTGVVLSVAALYRLISIVSETVGAGVASLDRVAASRNS